MIFLLESYLAVLAGVALVCAVALVPAALLLLAYEAWQKLIALLPRPQLTPHPAKPAVVPARANLVGARD